MISKLQKPIDSGFNSKSDAREITKGVDLNGKIAIKGKSLLIEYFNEDGDGLYPMTVQIVGKGSLYDPNNEKVRA